MFNFLYPRPVVDGRAVAVQIVQQKAAARPDTHTLVVSVRNSATGNHAAAAPDSGK